MKRVIFSLVVVAAIAVSAVVVTSCGNAQAQGGGRATVERWEYKVLSDLRMSDASNIETHLNSLGAQGWELVSQGLYNGGANSSSYNSVILKRKLQ